MAALDVQLAQRRHRLKRLLRLLLDLHALVRHYLLVVKGLGDSAAALRAAAGVNN